MSATPLGPDWWQAPDDKWYPPQQLPGATPGDETPSHPHGAGDSNRTALTIVAGVVVAAVVVALLVVLTGDDGDDVQTEVSTTPTNVASTVEGTEPVTTAAGSLSDREREVAALVAEGRTTRQVAKDLYVSPKTIETHLAHIYAKLGVSSRAAMVAALSPMQNRHEE